MEIRVKGGDIGSTKFGVRPGSDWFKHHIEKSGKGKLVTSPLELKIFYFDTFFSRLRHRKMKEGFEEMQKLKEYLCSIRLEHCSQTKSSPLTRQKLDKVLKNLKNNKARDPHGLINEIFHFIAIGDDLKESLFLLFNLFIVRAMKGAC